MLCSWCRAAAAGAVLGCPGAVLGCVGAMLGLCWGVLDMCWGCTWDVLGCAGTVLGCAGDMLVYAGAVLGMCWGCAQTCWGCAGAAALCWADPEARFDDDDADIAGGAKLSAKSPVASLCETEVACFACDTYEHSISSFKCRSLQRQNLSLSHSYISNKPMWQASVFRARSAMLLGAGSLLRMGFWKALSCITASFGSRILGVETGGFYWRVLPAVICGSWPVCYFYLW